MDNRFLLSMASEWTGVIAVCMIAGTSARFAHKPIGFVYTRREIIISALLTVAILALGFTAYYTGFTHDSDTFKLAEMNQLALAAAAIIPFAAVTIIRRQPLKSIGLNPLTHAAGLRLSLILALMTVILRGKVYAFLNGVQPEELLLLLVWLGICFMEEVIFRGAIQLRTVWAFRAPAGFLLTAVAFTLWRLPLFLNDPSTLWFNLGLTFIQSLVLSFVMHKSGSVLSPAIYRAVSTWLIYIA